MKGRDVDDGRGKAQVLSTWSLKKEENEPREPQKWGLEMQLRVPFFQDWFLAFYSFCCRVALLQLYPGLPS